MTTETTNDWNPHVDRILRQGLVRMGFNECDIDKWMDGSKRDA